MSTASGISACLQRTALVLALVLTAPLYPGVASAHGQDAPSDSSFTAPATRAQDSAVAEQLRRHPGGVRVSPRQVAYDHGAVVIDVGPAAYADCPSGRVCFFQDSNWTGRLLSWAPTSSILRRNFTDYGWNDQMSSWANRSSTRDARWYYNTNQSGASFCMNAGERSSSVGRGDDNEASSMAIFTDARACE